MKPSPSSNFEQHLDNSPEKSCPVVSPSPSKKRFQRLRVRSLSRTRAPRTKEPLEEDYSLETSMNRRNNSTGNLSAVEPRSSLSGSLSRASRSTLHLLQNAQRNTFRHLSKSFDSLSRVRIAVDFFADWLGVHWEIWISDLTWKCNSNAPLRKQSPWWFTFLNCELAMFVRHTRGLFRLPNSRQFFNFPRVAVCLSSAGANSDCYRLLFLFPSVFFLVLSVDPLGYSNESTESDHEKIESKNHKLTTN